MFCAPGLVFGANEGVGSRFDVLRSRTLFRRYRGRRVPFSCFARPDSFSTVPMASGPVLMFCAPELVFGGAEYVGSCFIVLRARLIFCGIEGVGCRFHILRSRTHFRRCRVRWVPFSYFACPESFSCFPLPDMFLAVGRALGPFFMFCAP
jgi:hypothetical protein